MQITPNSLFKNINSWDDFESMLLDFSKKEKGDAFELLTKYYFQINPILKSKYQSVWSFSELPQKELEFLGLPKVEIGIDIIAKTDNEYHAIQCKYHSDKTKAITFKEVSTFISLLESNAKLSQGYFCAYADSTSKNYKRLKTKPINQIMSDSWGSLDEAFFDNVRKLIEGKAPTYALFQPKEHQVKAIKEANNYFLTENQYRGKLIFPCGAGKSLTGLWIIQELKSTSTIVAVPSLSLVKQTLDVYLKQITAQKSNVKWLCICSDEGIGKDEDVVFLTENLGVPCNTNPEEIQNWLYRNRNENIIIFTTYQSGVIIADISKKLNFTFDTGIFDEAHKTVGSNKKLFSHLLFDENIDISKRIFMTATERFYSGSKDDIVSMDDINIYGETFASMTFKEAISLELLTDYKLITLDVKKSEIATFIKDNNLVQLNEKWKKETESRSLASMLALRKAMKFFPIKNAVSFHGSIDKAIRSKELQEHITTTYQYEPIDTYTVSGLIPTSKRNDIVQEFARSEKALITNARCLTEGVDVPNIDCIVFADPRSSKVDIVQALGRALRKKDGKDWGYVILPVIYDDEKDEIDNQSFSEIMKVVQGLASNDERIVEHFKEKNNKKPTSPREQTELFHFDVYSEYLDGDELVQNLEIKLWEKLAKLHWMPFEEAREYVRILGLKSQFVWYDFCKSGKKLNDIPNNPSSVYKNKGWISWGDWLGTGYISTALRGYRNFLDARDYVRNLNLKGRAEWKTYCENGNLPDDIPKSPDKLYRVNGWIGWGDWFGTDRLANYLIKYKNFSEARDYARGLNLKSITEWLEYCKSGNRPIDIPNTPDHVYRKNGWISYGDWLGTGYIANQIREYLDFKLARDFVRTLNLKNGNEWFEYCNSLRIPDNIPLNPRTVYKNKGWISMGDWLGTGSVAAYLVKYREFEKAKIFVKSLNLKSTFEWKEYCDSGNKPDDIPTNAPQTYRNKGWISWGDWLGTGNIANQNRIYKDFIEARTFVRSLNLKSSIEWKEYCKSGNKPDDIPTAVNSIYKNEGWISWGDWLGTGRVAPQLINYRNFIDARIFVRILKLKSKKEWTAYCNSGKKSDDLPNSPDRVYGANGWISWGDWLGTENIANTLRNNRDFEVAREFVRNLKLKNKDEWMNYCYSGQKPDDIPSNVHTAYKNKGWISMGDWLGTDIIANQSRIFKKIEEARKFAHSLKLTSKNEWAFYVKTGQKPNDIPSDPAKSYKNKGWISWSDWLGK